MHYRCGTGKFDALEALRGNKRSGFTLLSGRMCNASCIHCLTDSGPARKEFTKPAMAEKILDGIKPAMKNENVFFIAISGGEPLFNPDFMEEVAKKLVKISRELSIPLPIIPIVTNGTVWDSKLSRILKDVKNRVQIHYSPDEFHPKATQIGMFDRNGFSIQSPGAGRKLAALGRGYGLEGDYNWKKSCDAGGVKYETADGQLVMLRRKPTKQKFMVMENGDMALCGYGGLTFGNLANENIFDITDRLEKDELAVALMEKGPLGLAELMGKAKEAAEILMKKGACGVCHALKENLI